MSLTGQLFDSRRGYRLFQAVKYVTYLALCGNVYLFLREELLSLEHTFTGGLALGEVIQVFAATIDTAAWVILLLLFELETWVLDDEQIRGWTRRALHWTRLLCGAAIVYAFTGYIAELTTLQDARVLAAFDACARVAEGWSVLVDIDEYLPLSADNCAALGSEPLRIGDFRILAGAEALRAARWLAWTDVINAGAWILVVILLEVEVRLQLRGDLSDHIMRINKFLKFGVYGVLFLAAAYWGFAGDFLDFWDAFLWLFAFIFIELNVFDWQQETQGAAVQG
ncbi:MAG TPA: hypothetical protein VJ947_02970 [Pseudohaliea sp.]|nr:hypothetical protein [Pseudohaliea sp.]